MSTTLQAIIVVVAVAALSLVAVDSLNVWEWEKFAQNDDTNEYAADKNVLPQMQTRKNLWGTATASIQTKNLELPHDMQDQD